MRRESVESVRESEFGIWELPLLEGQPKYDENVLTIPAKARTAEDGTLSLEVPTGIPDTEVDVLIIVEAVRPCDNSSSPAAEWPKGFFELFESLREVNLERPPQGELQNRQPLE
jgi:hypothetical protein